MEFITTYEQVLLTFLFFWSSQSSGRFASVCNPESLSLIRIQLPDLVDVRWLGRDHNSRSLMGHLWKEELGKC